MKTPPPIDPNLLTAARLPIAPLAVVCMVQGTASGFGLALFLSLLLEITDFMDGKIARQYGVVTDFGKLFDPFSDAFCRYTLFLGLFAIGVADLWMLMVIFYRDASISFLRTIGATRKQVLAARSSGKIKAVVQGVGIQLIFVALLLSSVGVDLPGLADIPWWIMLVVTVVTGLSFIDYFGANYNLIRDAWSNKPVD
jgi:CDP-diacylglycerol--glycerol-3-phosphate 3-phosphatidyltransferase